MARDSIFRIASITKPIVAAAVMMLVDDGRIAPDDPVGAWLPELAAPSVVRTPEEPGRRRGAGRPADHGGGPAQLPRRLRFPAGLHLPAVRPLFADVQKDGREPQRFPPTDDLDGQARRHPDAAPAGRGMAVQHLFRPPGRADRAGHRPVAAGLPGRADLRAAGHEGHRVRVPAAKRDRFTSYYQPTRPAPWNWPTPPTASGAPCPPSRPARAGWPRPSTTGWRSAGCCSPAAPRAAAGCCPPSRCGDDHRPPHRGLSARGRLFLEGQGWGYGGAVDVDPIDPWNVPGRYGWVGGTGTSAHVVPATGSVHILLTQVGGDRPGARRNSCGTSGGTPPQRDHGARGRTTGRPSS